MKLLGRSSWKFGIAGAAVICFAAHCEGVGAQTLQPKKSAPQQSTPAPNVAPTQSKWQVNCSNQKEGLDCRAIQSIFSKTGQRMSVVVHMPPDKKPEMLIQLPLGIYLPGGTSVQIGEDVAKTLPFESCDQYGCMAKTPLSEAEIASMQKGGDLTITMQKLDKEPVTVPMPALGFAQAYAKIK